MSIEVMEIQALYDLSGARKTAQEIEIPSWKARAIIEVIKIAYEQAS